MDYLKFAADNARAQARETMHDSAEPRASRKQAGQTQEQAALLIGVARRTWQDWEAGISSIPDGYLTLYRHMTGIQRIPFHKRQA